MERGTVSNAGTRGALGLRPHTRDVWQRVAQLPAGRNLEGSPGGVYTVHRRANHGNPRTVVGRHRAPFLPHRRRRVKRLEKLRTAAWGPALFAPNGYIAVGLFFPDYPRQMGSIQAPYNRLARYNWRPLGQLSWFPLWYGGIPYA